jgi:hypothetical protein
MAFAIQLNGFLRGSAKARIDAALGALLLALLGSALLVFGWTAGALALVMSFVYAGLSRPLAARAAAALLSAGAAGARYVGLPKGALARISRELGRERSPQEFLADLTSGEGRKDVAEAALLEYCENEPSVAAVMRRHHLSRHDLASLYHELLAIGCGQWAGGHFVAASAVAHGDSLEFFLGKRSDAGSQVELAVALLDHFESGKPLQ